MTPTPTEFDWIAGFWRAVLGVSLLLIGCVIVACVMTVILDWPTHWNKLRKALTRMGSSWRSYRPQHAGKVAPVVTVGTFGVHRDSQRHTGSFGG